LETFGSSKEKLEIIIFSTDRKAIQQRGIVSCKADDVGKFCKLFC